MPDINPPSILITSAGRRVELVELFKNSAQKLFGPNANVYANDLNPSLSAACHLADQAFEICRCTDPSYPAQLLEQCLNHGVRLVIPTIDTELIALSEARDSFEAAGVNLVVSDSSLVKKCRNKHLTADIFKSLSINTPAILDPAKLTFPCFVKPIDGSCSQGVRAIKSSSELCLVDISNPNNLFQELVPQDWIEYTADLYYSKSSELLACVPRQRLETRGGEISKGIARKDAIHRYLRKHLAFIHGAKGVITVQVFTNPNRDQVLGIEVNPRFGGGYPMSHAAGVDYPTMLIKEYLLNESLPNMDNWQSDLLMLRYDAMVIAKEINSITLP